MNINEIKSLPRHSIYVMHFMLVGQTSIDRYFLRKGESERLETGAKLLVGGLGAKPLKAEYISINQFILEMNIQFSLCPLGKQKSEMSTGMKWI